MLTRRNLLKSLATLACSTAMPTVLALAESKLAPLTMSRYEAKIMMHALNYGASFDVLACHKLIETDAIYRDARDKNRFIQDIQEWSLAFNAPRRENSPDVLLRTGLIPRGGIFEGYKTSLEPLHIDWQPWKPILEDKSGSTLASTGS